MEILLDKSETPRLRFDSQEGAFNYARELVEDCKHFLTTHNLNLIERYRKGEIALELKIGHGIAYCNYDLLVVSIPPGRRKRYVEAAVGTVLDSPLFGSLDRYSVRDENRVLVRVGYGS